MQMNEQRQAGGKLWNGVPMASYNEYAKAVGRLVELASKTTSGGRAAAQVLLGTYNSYAFHLDCTDLCLLDPENLDAAITVLKARTLLRIEPHHCLKEGDAVFQAIWDRWESLHIAKRYAGEYEGA